PTGVDHVVDPAENRQLAFGGQSADVAGAAPAVDERSRRLPGVEAIAVGEYGTGHLDAVVLTQPDANPVEWDPVVHATACGLAHAVGGDHRNARALGPVPQVLGQGRTAEDDRVEPLGPRAARV